MRKPPTISDYELLHPIGSGAYGEVWLARGITGLLRAVKIVSRDKFGTAEPFEREFHGLTKFAAISLVASNQLALLHVGQDRDAGFFYYVMELADDIATGRDIDIERYSPCTLNALQQKKGRLSTEEAIAYGVGLARGLASLHSHGLVHRDIKPANIIFVGGTPKLADIGLVAAAELGLSIVGTEGFIPPEGPGSPAADVYSAGKVLYELNTGLDRKSFPALPDQSDPAIDHRRFLDLNEVVLRACANDPSRRYPTGEALLEDLVALQEGRGMLGKRVVRWMSPTLFRLSLGVGVVGVAAAGAWLWPKLSSSTGSLPVPNPISARSIAVLPFENLTPQSDFLSFADGMHEDVILRLAKIHDLQVISRASVVGYKGTKVSLKDIAVALRVGSILKGTVKREGGEVRVTVELVDPSTGFVRWGDKYKSSGLTEAFAIQSALSQQIAARLHAKLTENERRLVDHRPTANAAAYNLFLQARELFRQLGSYAEKDEYEKVVRLCEDAIKLDKNFAEAHVQLSLAHSFLYRFAHVDPSAKRFEKAIDAANEAERLRPNLPEAKLARGVVHYLARNWRSALLEFRAAENDLPNDEQLHWWMGNALRRANQWDAAIESFLLSSRLNPQPRVPLASLTAVQAMRYLRRFTEARDLAQAERGRFPKYRPLQAEYGRCQFEVDGDRAAFLNWMDNMPSGDTRDESTLVQRKYETAYRRGDWETADRMLLDPKLTGIGENPSYIDTPVALHRALVAWLADRKDDIGRHAEEAVREYSRNDWNPRQEPWAMIGRARAYALWGRANDALKMAQLAWKAVENIDATDAAIMRTKVAEVHIILGQTDEALVVLGEMMKRPADVGPHALRADPVWQKLAKDPRFEETLRSATPL